MSILANLARAVLLSFALAAALGACAVSRSVIDVQVAPGAAAAANAAPATPARREVEDARQFQLKPTDPSVPSLGDAEELKDPGITQRAVGRKRNTYGMALGDVVLPEGR